MEAPAEVNVINNMNNDANILKTEIQNDGAQQQHSDATTINGGTAGEPSAEKNEKEW